MRTAIVIVLLFTIGAGALVYFKARAVVEHQRAQWEHVHE